MPPRANGTYLNTITRNGHTLQYLRISAGPQRDRYVHQLVAEAMLGRPLAPDEEVDHKDTDTLNNDWRNLEVKTGSVHAKTTRTRATQRRIAARVADVQTCYQEDLADRRMDEAGARESGEEW